MSDKTDPFSEARRSTGVLVCDFDGESIPLVLRHADVRQIAKDWQTYSSDAPFRVPIPAEHDIRSVRQLPIETNPPDHMAYRAIVQPFFRRPTLPLVAKQIAAMIEDLLTGVLDAQECEIIGGFALPLQSRALTYLLNVPLSEADEWISWGTHAFREEGRNVPEKAAVVDRYINGQLDRAIATPGDDFFSTLATATFAGRSLTRDEMFGFAQLTFSGGRDTVINLLAGTMGHIAENPALLEKLRSAPEMIDGAAEEFIRFISPLTHIARVCAHDVEVKGHPVPADGRISLCWASANRDEAVFDRPDEVQLHRRRNPHVAFGSGHHNCLGAAQARLILRTVLTLLVERVQAMTILSSKPGMKITPQYQRQVGYEALVLRFVPL